MMLDWVKEVNTKEVEDRLIYYNLTITQICYCAVGTSDFEAQMSGIQI
jgi:hypothetical protein